MASYSNMLAEEIRDQEGEHDGKCYHDLTIEQRTLDFQVIIDRFCRKYNIKFYPGDDE